MPDESPRRPPRKFGHFELHEKLGLGGMSSVYKGVDTRSGVTVAVKVASAHVINDKQLSRRFELEFKIAQPLDHPNIVKVYEYGKNDKLPYLSMEYIDGLSLAQHLKKHVRLSEKESLAIILPVAEALSYLHNRQIIHRDIKPANILMTLDGVAKLADLGLVKNLESLSRLTRSNLGLGTLQFASPEQFDDARSADARSDVYALAATLYVMLTGEYPFGKGTMASVVTRKLKNDFDSPLSKAPDLNINVDLAIRRGLDADREKRPASVSEFIAIMGNAAKNATKGKKPALPGPEAAPMPAMIGKADHSKERRSSPRFSVELEAACRAAVNATGKRWPAWIVDVSKFGVCLHAQRRFEVGSVLDISFTLTSEGCAITLAARVRWARPTETKSWMLGCELVKAISDDDLNIICADRMDRTKMN